MRYCTHLLAAAFLACSTSCSDADDARSPEASAAADIIRAALTELNDCLADLRDQPGPQALFQFFEMENGKANARAWVQHLASALSEALELHRIDTERRYLFSAHTGTYSWDASTARWSRGSSPADAIVLRFPARRGDEENSARVSFRDFADRTIDLEGARHGAPTRLVVAGELDGDEVLGLSGAASYAANGFPVPLRAALDLPLTPYRFTLDYERISSTSFRGAGEFDGPGSCGVAARIELELLNDDYETFDFDADVDRIRGTLSKGDLQVVAAVDVDALGAVRFPQAAQFNSFVEADILFEGKRVAEVVAEDLGFEVRLRVVFEDGSSEDAAAFVEPFLVRLERDYFSRFGAWH
jgi:hypothetical protein